jgi:hypothetical protein
MLLIVEPLTFVVLKLTDRLTVTIFLPITHTTDVFRPIRISYFDIPFNLSMNEVGLYLSTISKFKNTRSMSQIMFVRTFVFEIVIIKMINTFTMSLFCLWIQLTLIFLYNKSIYILLMRLLFF